jgi:pyruvate-ferredoxin/flavodoxin oxidoreductase
MAQGPAQQKRAVDSGVWPLYRFDPVRLANGKPALHLDYGPPKVNVADYMGNESRFRMIERADPERYKKFIKESQEAARRRYIVYEQLAGISVPAAEPERPQVQPPNSTVTDGK